jgi:hypothetical protein
MLKGDAMQVAVRPYLTSGVALVGASVIAVSPVVVTPPDIHLPAMPVSSAAVELTAVTNPITAWLDVLSSALGNATALGGEWLSDPAPLLRQFIENQLGYAETALTAGQGVINGFIQYINPANPSGLVATLQTAFGELTSGDIAGAVETTAQALILLPILNLGLPLLTSGLLEIPATIAQNVANVVATLTSVDTALPIVLGGLGTVLGPINAFGDSLQAVFDAATSLDPLAAVGALLSAPAVITGALINGYTNAEGTEFPGLLTFGDNPFNSGLLQSLLINLPRALAAAITPAAPITATTQETAAIAATTSVAATTVTLDVAPAADESGAADTEAAASDVAAGSDDDEADSAVAADEEATDEADADDATATDGDATDTGATDLSDGNKATPGESGGDEGSDAGSGDTDTDAETDPDAGTETTSGDAAGDSDSGSDSEGGSGDSD